MVINRVMCHIEKPGSYILRILNVKPPLRRFKIQNFFMNINKLHSKEPKRMSDRDKSKERS